MRNSALLLCVTLLLFSAQSFGQREGAQNPTAVIVAPVVSREFADQVEALGTTRANESVVITADRSEKVMDIHFDDGQAVKVVEGRLDTPAPEAL